MLAVMAGDGAVGGFGFEGFAVGGDEDRGHESQGSKTLGYYVGLDISVIIWEDSALHMRHRKKMTYSSGP